MAAAPSSYFDGVVIGGGSPVQGVGENPLSSPASFGNFWASVGEQGRLIEAILTLAIPPRTTISFVLAP